MWSRTRATGSVVADMAAANRGTTVGGTWLLGEARIWKVSRSTDATRSNATAR
jgi:hypothetical protein